MNLNRLATVFSVVQSVCSFVGSFYLSNGTILHSDINGNQKDVKNTATLLHIHTYAVAFCACVCQNNNIFIKMKSDLKVPQLLPPTTEKHDFMFCLFTLWNIIFNFLSFFQFE